MADSTDITASPPPPPGPTGITTIPDVVPVTGGETPEHKPFVPDKANIPEFTWSAVLVGAVLGIIFGASSLYLVLKVGLTVSASIPVAVLSITLFRVLGKILPRGATILENNIVQTTGSAGESIAFGVGVTMPALMLLGFQMSIGRVMVVSILGGLLGILMMIPLRRAFIVKQHGKLKYPEGTACADVLIAGEKGGATAKAVFVGFGLAFVYEFIRSGFKLFKDTADYSLKWFKGAVPSIEVNPALLGVGYIIGPRISAVMAAGGVLASFVLIPAIRLFGDGLEKPLYPATKLISKMTEEEIWHEYVLYIGAGAVAAGGIISVFQALPLIISSMKAGLKDLRASAARGNGDSAPRTDRDMPLRTVAIGSLVLVGAIWATTPLHAVLSWVPDLQMHFLGAVLIVLFGFLFVTVSSRLTGEIGSSSNPISGMTVATLLLTCLIFVALHWTQPEDRLTALSVAAVVCIAASNGGTTSQDLKTGYLVGATPKWQQWAIVVGALTSALVIGIILIQLNEAYTIYTSRNLPTLDKPLDVSKLNERAKAPGDDTEYHVWRAPESNDQGVPQGEYLVDDQGRIRYLVDPGINGKRTHRDDGTEVPRFKAPKAVLMSLITDGILRQKLPWSLVLLGVSISIVLELCGIPSLAFAVGVYLPLSSSTPILAGGMARWLADRWARGRAGTSGKTPEQLEAEAETSPGSLLSTGYIAGGAIAGVIIAFLSFSDTIPNVMATWQYRTEKVAEQASFDDAAAALAARELGYKPDDVAAWKKEVKETDDANRKADLKAKLDAVSERADEIADLNSEMKPQLWKVPAGFKLKLPHNKEKTVTEDTTLGAVAKEEEGSAAKAGLLQSLNLENLIRVPKDTELDLPKEKKFKTTEDATLGQVAEQALGKADRAQELYELNEKKLEPEVSVPAGTVFKIPQPTWPALVAFGLLFAILVLVGAGFLLKAPAPTNGNGNGG